MKRSTLYRSAVVACLLLLAGCMKRPPNYAAMPADDLYQLASTAYEERNFGRATQLLDVFVQQHLGDPRAPQARLLLGQAHMERKEFLTAATHFQRLINDFPASPLQREARFGICEAYTRLSPRPPLDQEYTQSAVLHCESVAESYPGTEEGREAAEQVVELRDKLARKLYETGLYYFKRRAYDSAVVYFNEVLDLYPQTRFAPTALSQLIQTYDLIGFVEEAQEARERLQRDYPDSPEARALRA
jgi:outer membrane protein assembly factor BamD